MQGREGKSGTSAREKFSPSGRGGHKNLGNAATFPEFLGGRTNFSLAWQFIGEIRPCARTTAKGKLSPRAVRNWRGSATAPATRRGKFYPQFLVEPLTNHLDLVFTLKGRQVPGIQLVDCSGSLGIPRNSPSFHRLSPNTLSWGTGVKSILGVVFTSPPKCGGIRTTLMLFFE